MADGSSEQADDTILSQVCAAHYDIDHIRDRFSAKSNKKCIVRSYCTYLHPNRTNRAGFLHFRQIRLDFYRHLMYTNGVLIYPVDARR